MGDVVRWVLSLILRIGLLLAGLRSAGAVDVACAVGYGDWSTRSALGVQDEPPPTVAAWRVPRYVTKPG